MTLKRERRCPTSDLCIPSARWGMRWKCTSKKTHTALSHVAEQQWILAAVGQNFSLEEHSECLWLFMGCPATEFGKLWLAAAAHHLQNR